jgi:beta-glucosidase
MTAVGLATAGTAAAQAPSCPWMDTSRTPDQRAQALLAASTLDQKLRWLDEQAANDPTNLNAGGKPLPAQVPCTPFIAYADGPTAVVAGTGVTAFPSQTALAASWDQDLARRKGKAQGYEAFHKRRNVLLAPGLSTARTPLAGRTSEYLGEDPLLSGRMAAAVVKGFGDNPAEPVESVLKHWVANEQETDRQTSSSNLDERTLHELYALPFEIAIKDGQPGGVMCSYNQVNGIYSCNQPILRQILKGDIGFDGWVVTDFGASHSLTATPNSLAAGLDQELNRWRNWTPDALKAALADGRITQAMIDEAAFRVVRAHIRAGLFDTPLPAAPEADVSTPADQAVAREEVEQGSVLLKNTGVLPLGGAGKKIAVIGPTASATPTDGISAASVCGPTRPSVPCTPKAPLDAIAVRAAQDGGMVTYSDGHDRAQAAQTAAAADVAIVFGYCREGEFDDRPNLDLDGGGDALVAAVAAANPNTVVVLQTGGAVLMPWLDSVRAVLETWSPGQEMGPRHRRAVVGRRQPVRPAAAELPAGGRGPADSGLARPVPGRLLRRQHYAAAGHQRDPPGRLHGAPEGRLPLVRQHRHRAAVPVRLRPVVHDVRRRPAGRAGALGGRRAVHRALPGDQHRHARRHRHAPGLPRVPARGRRAAEAPRGLAARDAGAGREPDGVGDRRSRVLGASVVDLGRRWVAHRPRAVHGQRGRLGRAAAGERAAERDHGGDRHRRRHRARDALAHAGRAGVLRGVHSGRRQDVHGEPVGQRHLDGR